MDADGSEKADDKRAHHGKPEVSPEATADGAIVKIGPHVEADNGPAEGAEDRSHRLARAVRGVKGMLIAGNEGQVQELDPPAEDGSHRITTGGIAEDQIRDLQKNAPVRLEQLHAAAVCDERLIRLNLGEQDDEEEEQERDPDGEKEKGRLA